MLLFGGQDGAVDELGSTLGYQYDGHEFESHLVISVNKALSNSELSLDV